MEHEFDLKAFIAPLVPKTISVPEGTKCLKCGSAQLTRTTAMAWGPFGGIVTCSDCGHKGSVMNYLGKSCITVEPLISGKE